MLGTHAPYGTYGCTGSSAVRSWTDIAHAVFEAANGNGDRAVPVSTADYYASDVGPIAPRPVHSALDLSKLESVGFRMPVWKEELGEYLKTLEELSGSLGCLASRYSLSLEQFASRLRVFLPSCSTKSSSFRCSQHARFDFWPIQGL